MEERAGAKAAGARAAGARAAVGMAARGEETAAVTVVAVGGVTGEEMVEERAGAMAAGARAAVVKAEARVAAAKVVVRVAVRAAVVAARNGLVAEEPETEVAGRVDGAGDSIGGAVNDRNQLVSVADRGTVGGGGNNCVDHFW